MSDNRLKISNRHVLVVDDDADSRALVGRLLTLHGLRVLTAEHGLDALGFLDNALILPALIVLDLEMPVMDGRQFLVHRQGRPTWRHVPVIMLSGADDAETRVADLEVAAFLRKPIQTPRLLAHVDTVLGRVSPPAAGITVEPSAGVLPEANASTSSESATASADATAPGDSGDPADPTSVPDPGAPGGHRT